MRFTKIFSALVVAVGLMAPAQAGILLEPYLGYGTGELEQGNANSDISGFSLGARVGFSTLGFGIGVEYMTGAWSDDSTPESDYTPADLGVFVSYDFPVMFRAFGTYFVSSKWNSDNGTTDGDFEGTGIKIGVGFTGLPVVSINLEYIMHTWDEFEGAELTNELEHTSYMLSVSAPFSF